MISNYVYKFVKMIASQTTYYNIHDIPGPGRKLVTVMRNQLKNYSNKCLFLFFCFFCLLIYFLRKREILTEKRHILFPLSFAFKLFCVFHLFLV